MTSTGYRRIAHLPRGAAAWAMYAAVVTVLSASSIAPFVRLSPAGPRVNGGDFAEALLYTVAWIPFASLPMVLTAPRTSTRLPTAAMWLIQATLLVVSPPLHSAFYLTLTHLIHASPVDRASIFGVEFFVLTMLGILQYLVILAVLYAILAGRHASESVAEAAELALSRSRLQAQLGAARLDALRSQLQPHFLFNTLNSISVLIGSDVDGARTMLRRLSDLLRAVLSGNDAPEVTLRRELELLEHYIDIQKVRFGARLKTTVRADVTALDALVPVLLLQPLVENAIQYSVASREDGGSVDVSVSEENGRLVMEIVDQGASEEFEIAVAPGSKGSERRGLGRSNTAARLRQMYGNDYQLTFDQSPGGCRVCITIPFSTAASLRPGDNDLNKFD